MRLKLDSMGGLRLVVGRYDDWKRETGRIEREEAGSGHVREGNGLQENADPRCKATAARLLSRFLLFYFSINPQTIQDQPKFTSTLQKSDCVLYVFPMNTSGKNQNVSNPDRRL